ncbi:MAG: Coenzyme F420 hydrogenase/dehydrogenase, beta subunit C-terminal domain [Clostridia bacterium]|nr:Coenzyme F420 hydrogenase/dehydrogenase, beta subunit C-terminal domain [Clostridia bacterium]
MKEAYILKHKDNHIRMESRSGGAFTLLSDWILQRGGVVYGCMMDENLVARHQRAESSEDRDSFRGSKYVQSNLGNTFKCIRDDLEKGRYVCFSGFACQIKGLLNFLSGVNTEKLYTICIVCHYVTSPRILRDYIKMQEQKHKGKVSAINFRNKKKYGWEANWETLSIQNKEIDSTYYAQTFYSGLTARESCYKCYFRSVDLPGDITIADAWGINDAAPEFNDNKGVSLVLVQTDKGDDWFLDVKEDCVSQQVNIDDYMQGPFIKAYSRPENRDEFWKMIEEKGLNVAFKHFIKTPMRKRIIRKLKKIQKSVSKCNKKQTSR